MFEKKSINLEGKLGITYPIFQGGMAHISDSNLVAAVCEAGGLGILATGHMEPDKLRDEIKNIRKKTSAVFAVNIVITSRFCSKIIDLLCEEGVKIVVTGNGDPGKYMTKLTEANIHVIPVVSSAMMAMRMEKLGAAAIIAEGTEAGGHVGRITTMCLIPIIKKSVTIPIIAAGGIATGNGMAAAFNLGAEGVQLGTRFLLAQECKIHKNYKEKLIKSTDFDTTITQTISGIPVRGIKNNFTRNLERFEIEQLKNDRLDRVNIEAKTSDALEKAVNHGDIENGSLMAGQISALLEKEETCQSIINSIIKEWNECALTEKKIYEL